MRLNGTCRSHKGSAYLYVIIIFLVVTLFSTIMLSTLNQAIYQSHTYSMRMQAYYLTDEAADATVAVLLDDSDDLLNHLSYPQTDTMIHTSGGDVIGTSKITLTKEFHNYYGENKEWIVAKIKTEIPDQRGSREGEMFSFEGSVMILLENSMIQLYNIDPDTLG